MPRYRLTVAYDGTNFHGWQKQCASDGPAQESLRTVQGVLEQAIVDVVRERVSVQGSSRTDAGVHAVGQVAAFSCQMEIAPDRLAPAINSRLPDDAQVRSASIIHEGFSPISDAISKGYRYRIAHGRKGPPPAGLPPLFSRHTTFWTPYRLDPLRMNEAARRLVGEHDFNATDAEAGWAEFCTANFESIGAHDYENTVPYWNSVSSTGILSHVCIDRYHGAAAHEKLFFEEFVPEEVSFNVEIAATRLTKEEIALVLAILEQATSDPTHPCQFGANGANGWGRMAWELNEVKLLEGRPVQLSSGQAGFDCCSQVVEIASASLDELIVPAHILADLKLECCGPFLVNDTSHTKEKDAEDSDAPNFIPLCRAAGTVWLAASSFRGALRERAEFLLRSLDPQATGDPNRSLGDGPIERIFGKTSHAARLTIAEPTELGRCETPKQDFVAIDRFTGGAADGAKFAATYADRPQFQTKLRLDLDGLEPEDTALLGLALRDVCQGKVPLGWGGSKGYGEVSGSLTNLSSKDVPQDWEVPESMATDTLDHAGKNWLSNRLRLLFDEQNALNIDRLGNDVSQVMIQEGTLSVTKTKKGLDYSLSYV
ncbi:MAG: hypothetical protein IH889_00265, partial [Planctomycetes bacterium]|nr:hypothetical protein [Planctomycetota bacterium]